MFRYKYLSKEHLEGFNNYKYTAVDTSPLSVNVMHPFWDRVVEYVPKWVAPNLLTFAGFLLTVADFTFLSYYDYDYTASMSRNMTDATDAPISTIPQSLWPLLAAFLFLAYTLDGIDGKQARRTGTSGPLGELFDHGLDSYSAFFIPACLYSIFGRGDYSIPITRMYYVLWSILLNFYLSHWEKYNTGVLFLPWGYDFSMWASTFFFLFTGIVGTQFYKKKLFGITVANCFECLIYATGVFTNLPVALYNIYYSYKNKTGKMRSLSEAVRPLCSPLALMAAGALWQHGSTDPSPRPFLLLIGTVFSNAACRLIVAQMSNQRCELFNALTWPLLVGGLLSLAIPILAPALLHANTALAIAAHIHYGTCVVRQMCEHFRIGCFHIKKRED